MLDTPKNATVLDTSALTLAAKVASLPIKRRNTIPILSSLRLVGDGETLTLTGTDLDSEFRVSLPCFDTLNLTLPAASLNDLLKTAKGRETIAFNESKGIAVFDAGVHHTMSTLPVEDFPDLPEPKEPSTLTLPLASFQTALQRVAFAISTEETRYYLNGVCMHPKGNTLAFVTTDGHRLASFQVGATAKAMPGVILPRVMVTQTLKAFDLLRRAKQLPLQIDLSVSASRVRLAFGPVQINARVIDGTFPDYERAVPRHNENLAVVPVRTLKDALAQVMQAHAGTKQAGVKFAFTQGQLGLSVHNPDVGNALTSIAVSYNGSGLEIGFNGRYVLSILAETTGPDVTIAMSDAGSPAVFTDATQPHWYTVLMPMRV